LGLSLLSCFALAACGGGGSTPAAASPTSGTQSVETSTTVGTPLSAQTNGISVTAELPPASAATTVAYAFTTTPPANVTIEPAAAYLCLTPAATISFSELPTFALAGPVSLLPPGSAGYVALYNPATSAAGWIEEQGPISIQTSSATTFTSSTPLGPAASTTFGGGQTSCFAFQTLSGFGSTTIGF
jgi:hypothetical protein